MNGSIYAIRCGLDFFGSDRALFGTDCPFDPQGGPMFIRESLRAIGELDLEQEVLDKLMHGNAEPLADLGDAQRPLRDRGRLDGAAGRRPGSGHPPAG